MNSPSKPCVSNYYIRNHSLPIPLSNHCCRYNISAHILTCYYHVRICAQSHPQYIRERKNQRWCTFFSNRKRKHTSNLCPFMSEFLPRLLSLEGNLTLEAITSRDYILEQICTVWDTFNGGHMYALCDVNSTSNEKFMIEFTTWVITELLEEQTYSDIVNHMYTLFPPQCIWQ